MEHRSGWLAKRQDSIEAMRPERAEDDAFLAGMLRVAAHRRACHGSGHRLQREKGEREARRCERCTPEKCGECKAESMAVWDGKRWALQREANEILKAGVRLPDAPKMRDQDALWILLLLSL